MAEVVVLGMGFAGLAAALAASDAGASVLLVDKETPELAGGNSRICSQGFIAGVPGAGPSQVERYFRALSGMPEGMDSLLDESLGEFSLQVSRLADTLSARLGLPRDEIRSWSGHPRMGFLSPEYPEYPGSESVALHSAHAGMRDGYLYGRMRDLVEERAESGRIRMVFGMRAVSLDREKDVWRVGLEDDSGTSSAVEAPSVCLCTGGFAGSGEMCAKYLGLESSSSIGASSNAGEGLELALQAGASLWHMDAYEGGFGFASMGFAGEERAVNVVPLFQNAANSGASFAVGGDGRRFCNESAVARHGHVQIGKGEWGNPAYPQGGMWALFDSEQWGLLCAALKPADLAVAQKAQRSSEAPRELAQMLGIDLAGLEETLRVFNTSALRGEDPDFGRAASTMRAFEGGKLFAVPLRPLVLNTQGGPRRDIKGRILDDCGLPIPGLYGAGELGGLTCARYQAGTNVSECLISGFAAGSSAAFGV